MFRSIYNIHSVLYSLCIFTRVCFGSYKGELMNKSKSVKKYVKVIWKWSKDDQVYLCLAPSLKQNDN